MDILFLLSQTLLLVLALSFDSFVSGFAYGSNNINIPFRSSLVLNLICSSVLIISILFGALAGSLLPDPIARAVCFCILLVLGLIKLFDATIKAFIRRIDSGKQFNMRILNLRFVLNVYADPEHADIDKSKTLSAGEAVYLALALSLDSLTVGFGAGTDLLSANITLSLALTILLSFSIGMIAVISGCTLGKRLAKTIPVDLSWASGILLIALAIMRI